MDALKGISFEFRFQFDLKMKQNTTNETLESPPAKKVYQKYTLDFKLKVINLAKKSANKRQTAREMNIDEKLVRYWVKEEEKKGEAQVEEQTEEQINPDLFSEEVLQAL